MEMSKDNSIEIAEERIRLPDWLPKHALDSRTGPAHHEYWSMIANGSIFLLSDQLDIALQIAVRIEELLHTTS